MSYDHQHQHRAPVALASQEFPLSARRTHLPTRLRHQASPRITSVEALLQRISAEFEQLSKQHKVIARYLGQHCDHVGMEKIQNVAERCCVTPSAIVRFAKHFGFHGYMELKALFRGSVDQEIATSRVCHDRIHDALEGMPESLSSADVTHEFIRGALTGMRELQRDIHDATLGEAVDLMAGAQALWVAGACSAFPVAAYLAYGLQHTRKSIQLITHVGAMQAGQLRGLRADDVMIAVSFAPHAEETLTAAQIAASNGTKLIVITDSATNALAREADVVLLVQESCTFGFRALTNSMALAQGIFIALAYRIETRNHAAAGVGFPEAVAISPAHEPFSAGLPIFSHG